MQWNILTYTRVCLVLALSCVILAQIPSEDVVIPCDVDSKTSTCPSGMCCVRNESLFGQMYCQHFGSEGDICANYTSEFLCGCTAGFDCKIDADGLFGTCKQKNLDIPCNISSRHDICPPTHCCVRGEFLFTYTYCKPYGVKGDNCVTRPSFYECPCRQGLHCHSNLASGHVNSVFGKCQESSVPVG